MNKRAVALTLLTLTSCCPTLPLSAQILKQREGIAADKETIASDAKTLNITCASHIAVSVDYDSYKAAGGVDEDHNAPWKDCRNTSDPMEQMCGGSDEAKASIGQKIDKVVCGWSAKEEISLQGKTLHYSTPYGAGNPIHVKEFLEKNL